jgi:beta-galactosidase
MYFSHMIYGGDYNPDQWPEETWLEDARLMQEARVNLVSLGIFSWAKLEPRPGIFEFTWLDWLMDMLHAHGISVNLAMPTAAPPAWMVRMHPEMLPVTADGVRLWHGSRRHYCPHNPDYHRYATRIAAQLAERYKDTPALVMWHVDNEYGCHVSECYCDISAASFREWLKNRYTTLEKLNFAWGTAFWGQVYGDWNEIKPPLRTPAHANPTQQLDWARFSSNSWLACFDEQKVILKRITPNLPVTTNFMGFYKGVDYFKFSPHEDVVSQDSYPDTYEPDWMVKAGMAYDLIRSVGVRHTWLLMEQAASQVNWRQRNVNKRPGVMRLGSLQAVARGADGIMFFQWRQSKAGAEKYHSGMLPHTGPDSRIWREIKALGNELPLLNSLLSSQVQAEVAILMDWENWWALELDSKPSNDLKLHPQIYSYYKMLFERSITVDFAHPDTNLSCYKLVVAPTLYLVSDHSSENINRYVENGGTLLFSFFSGIVDENEHIRLGGYPASFCEMLGLTVEEYTAYPKGLANTLRTTDGRTFTCSLWSDVICVHGCEALAVYESDYYAGLPAITRHKYGKGLGYYLGTELESAGLDWLLGLVCAEAGIMPVLPHLPAGVEALRRSKEGKSWLFLLNHTGSKVQIPIENAGRDLLTGEAVNNSISMETNSVVVLELDNKLTQKH